MTAIRNRIDWLVWLTVSRTGVYPMLLALAGIVMVTLWVGLAAMLWDDL